jgi:hypothetical protein
MLIVLNAECAFDVTFGQFPFFFQILSPLTFFWARQFCGCAEYIASKFWIPLFQQLDLKALPNQQRQLHCPYRLVLKLSSNPSPAPEGHCSHWTCNKVLGNSSRFTATSSVPHKPHWIQIRVATFLRRCTPWNTQEADCSCWDGSWPLPHAGLNNCSLLSHFLVSVRCVTNSIEQIRSWESNNFLACQEIHPILRNPSFHYRLKKARRLAPILS